MREEALSTKIEQLLDEKTCVLTGQKNIWDLGYKSTSDEEDNDSDDNTQKPRLAKDNEPP